MGYKAFEPGMICEASNTQRTQYLKRPVRTAAAKLA